ncbi:MAG: hypothetical protein DI585_00245 [Pseudomonas fluorescens]|nr:MAG: hypothetical protein DI585_00245 [Pseudomonas fluorescens]
MKKILFAIPLLAMPLAACGKDAPCIVCYEDEWSREPFPGQPKQHLGTLSPDQVKRTGGHPSPALAAEFLGTVSPSSADGTRW